jgi:predicted nucleotidyltransferase
MREGHKITEIGEILEEWDVVRHLKNVLHSLGIDVHQIILFGSRARGESTMRSDYDFLIIVNGAIDFQERRKIIRLIRRRMAEQLIPVDVFIKSKADFERHKKVVGNIAYSANKEGVIL